MKNPGNPTEALRTRHDGFRVAHPILRAVPQNTRAVSGYILRACSSERHPTQPERRAFHHAARKSENDIGGRFGEYNGEQAARESVSDGLSPNRRRDSREKRPIWGEPHWIGISVALSSGCARPSRSRIWPERALRRGRRGE